MIEERVPAAESAVWTRSVARTNPGECEKETVLASPTI
jgi:hypothetical protein